MNIDTHFASRLDAISDAPSPFSRALRDNLRSPQEPVRLLGVCSRLCHDRSCTPLGNNAGTTQADMLPQPQGSMANPIFLLACPAVVKRTFEIMVAENAKPSELMLGNGVCLLLHQGVNQPFIEANDSYLTLEHVKGRYGAE
jgi:hypothetical protein